MKSKFFQHLLWPNLWVGIFTVLALVGIICLLAGHKVAGLWLLAPLLLTGLVLIIVVIPILILANRKHQKRGTKGPPTK
jgi:Mn2+/Fe2+ NRAMP family transporter